IGLKYVHFLSDRTRIVSNLALSLTRSYERLDSLIDGEYTKMIGEERFKQDRLLVSSKLIKKFNARNLATVGISFENHFVEYYERYNSIIYNTPDGDSLVLLPPTISRENSLVVFQSFLEWKHRFSYDLTLYTGMNYLHFFMNNTYSLEPRTNLQWKISKNQSLSIGYGLHSQLQPFFYYLVKTPTTDDIWDRDNYIQTNRDLGFTKSHQFAFGYDYSISRNLRLKAEIYYQSLYNIPVESRKSPLSLINVGAGDEFPQIDSLVNQGTGRNSGIEFTLEKFLSNRYYFLTTASLLDSKYEGSDGVTRNTTFNIHFNLNALFGYELPLNDRSSLYFNIRGVSAGGRRVVPLDEERTIEEGMSIYNLEESFELQLSDYYRLDARLGYKLNADRASHEFAIDVTNLTNRPNEFRRYYNSTTNQIETMYQQGIFFIAYYRVRF
ncbi:MAG: TonB-dependent receptor, partial [Bacteroidales bacterium]|nr:TonB-dependent receptor [Bacteroidales bacterium]